nr:MAG TPA: DNA terminal protein [Caudoviricetes sp.]
MAPFSTLLRATSSNSCAFLCRKHGLDISAPMDSNHPPDFKTRT